MALKCIVPVKSSGRQSMLSKDPVTENSHLRYFCKVVLQRRSLLSLIFLLLWTHSVVVIFRSNMVLLFLIFLVLVYAFN